MSDQHCREGVGNEVQKNRMAGGQKKYQVNGTQHPLVVKSTGLKFCLSRPLARKPEDLETCYLTFQNSLSCGLVIFSQCVCGGVPGDEVR